MDTKELGDSSPTNFEEECDKQNIRGKNTSKLVGDKGERIACEYLVKNRYKILERNCVLFCGEIDIIARKRWGLFSKKDKTIHFVEVKSLSGQGKDFFPEQRVDYKKQNKYRRLAEIWLEKNKLPENIPYQIDIVAVSVNETTGEPKIDYFENIVSSKNYGF